MGISPLAGYNSLSTQSSALQALLAQNHARNSGQTGSTTDPTGDQLSVSPMAQYLAKAPKEIAAPLQDLMGARKDVTADLKAVQTYFTAHPEERARLDAAMQLQSANPAQGAAMLPAMQAGIVDLYALSSELDETSGTKLSTGERGKAILALLQNQGSLLDSLNTTSQTTTSQGQASLFSYLS